MGIDKQLNRYSENSELECVLLSLLQPQNQTGQDLSCINGDPQFFFNRNDQCYEKLNNFPRRDVSTIDNWILKQDNFLDEYTNTSERNDFQCNMDSVRCGGSALQPGVGTLSPLIESDEMPESFKSPSTVTDSKISEGSSSKNLVWVDQLNLFLPSLKDEQLGSTRSELVATPKKMEEIERRVLKRKRRRRLNDSAPDEENFTKRARNTIAARKYRQRRLEEVEVLSKKVKELEEELSKSKLETSWWQMEARRWQACTELYEKK